LRQFPVLAIGKIAGGRVANLTLRIASSRFCFQCLKGFGFTIARKTREAVQPVLPSQTAISYSLNVTGLAVPPSRDPHNLTQWFSQHFALVTLKQPL
jgi:hypothetical protein